MIAEICIIKKLNKTDIKLRKDEGSLDDNEEEDEEVENNDFFDFDLFPCQRLLDCGVEGEEGEEVDEDEKKGENIFEKKLLEEEIIDSIGLRLNACLSSIFAILLLLWLRFLGSLNFCC